LDVRKGGQFVNGEEKPENSKVKKKKEASWANGGVVENHAKGDRGIEGPKAQKTAWGGGQSSHQYRGSNNVSKIFNHDQRREMRGSH